MAKDMLGTATRKLVTLPHHVLVIVCDLLEKLADQEWVAALKQFLRKENPWVATGLLEDAGTITIPAVPACDVASLFKETPQDRRKDVDVPIAWMGENAKRIVKGLSEAAVAEATLNRHKLLRNSVDIPIVVELGGAQNIRTITTSWGQMYEAMKTLDHDHVFVFYVPDADGTIWAARCCWGSGRGGWDVGANPVTCPSTWYAGSVVVSR